MIGRLLRMPIRHLVDAGDRMVGDGAYLLAHAAGVVKRGDARMAQNAHREPLCRQSHRIARIVLHCVFGGEALLPSGKLGPESPERAKDPV